MTKIHRTAGWLAVSLSLAALLGVAGASAQQAPCNPAVQKCN